MKTRFAFLALLLAVLALFWGCESADNPIAPTGSVITVNANPTLINLNGQSSTITITGFRPDGNPLNPGTQITLSTNLGVLRTTDDPNGPAANLVEVQDGRATAYLFGDGRQGPATITASLTSGGDGASATIDVQVGSDDTSKPTVTMTANPTEVDVNQPSTLTIQARSADGSPLAGATVTLRTSLGTLSNANPVTGSDGEATTTLRSSQSGQATITASVDSSDEVEATVEVGTTRKPQLILNANPSQIETNLEDDSGVLQVGPDGQSRITIIARDNNGNPLGSGERISLFADLGTIAASSSIGVPGGQPAINSVVTNSNGEAEVFFYAGVRSGNGEISAILGNSDEVSQQIVIDATPASFTFRAEPRTIDRLDEGDTVTLEATVVDAEGRAASGVLVRFDSDAGTLSASSLTTNSSGVASSTLTVTTQDLGGASEFFVRAIVTIQGQDETQEIRIEVDG